MQHITHEQLTARDDTGEQHRVMIRRTPVPGAPHLPGPARYSWKHGEPLHLVDSKAGVLQGALGECLQIENWRG